MAEPAPIKENGQHSRKIARGDLSFSSSIAAVATFGRTIPATVTLKNTGKEKIRFGYHLPPENQNFEVNVLDGAGQDVPLTDYGRRLLRPNTWSGVTLPILSPGQDLTARYDLQELFQLQTPGTYCFVTSCVLDASVSKPQVTIIRLPFRIQGP